MSYISAKRVKNNIVIWKRDENGRSMITKPAPFYFYTENPNGTYESIYGDKLIRHDFTNSADFYLAKDEYKNKGKKTFESDIPSELKLLSEQYYGVPSPELTVSLFDIEVDYDPKIGFASVANPYAPINSITTYHRHKKKFVVLAVPPEYASREPTDTNYGTGPTSGKFIEELQQITPIDETKDISIHFFKTEKELLTAFVNDIQDSDVISGWNCDFFDTPYVCKRIELVAGRNLFKKMSFEFGSVPTYRDVEMMGKISTTADLDGRISADYMVLFKKYEVVERPSYKLESIADEILPDLPKLEYEGSLATLYRSNFPWFIRYNLRDTEILEGFEERLGYIALANDMYHMSTGLFKHVTGTLKLAELATINMCHYEFNNKIVNDNDANKEKGKIQGAFVLLPQIGVHEKIGSIDIHSLYPSSIRSLNISPETIIGQFVHYHMDKAGNVDTTWVTKQIAKGTDENLDFVFDDTTNVPKEYRGEYLTATAKQWRKVLLKKKWAVSGYGTVFDQNKQGIVPKILAAWYTARQEFQRKKKAAEKSGDKLQAAYYHRLQYVYKIKLNSFYGAFSNAYFRFYDLRMGESTTGTGRLILIHQCAKACEYLDGEYSKPNIERVISKTVKGVKQTKVHFGYDNNWSVTYGDTDSSYFVIKDPSAKTQEDITKIADATGEYVNASFPEFMRHTFLCTPGFDEIIKTGREIVSDRGIFVDKKRYILHIVDNEGTICDKLKVMGLDTKKTTLPKQISKKLNSFIERFLKGEEWSIIAKDIVNFKEYINTTNNLMDIGLPKGVNNVENYAQDLEIYNEKTRVPGHVRASIYYNQQLTKFNDTKSIEITSGTKIKVFYIREVNGKFNAIAIPVDIEEFPSWFNQSFTIDRDKHIERLVDKPLGNILKAIGKESPSQQSIFLDNALTF